jgi:hypothetical protein
MKQSNDDDDQPFEGESMNAQAMNHDDDMPSEIDFSKGVRGKFYSPNAVFHVPLYLDVQVQTYLSERARAKGIDLTHLVNDLLRKDIELIEAAS